MKRKGILGAGFILLALAVMAGSGMAAPPASSSRAAAPDFQLTGLDGKPLQLSSYRGKVVLLDFWATWCPPCRAEIPHFKELQTAYQGKGLEIIGIAMDQDGPEGVKSFLQAEGVSYRVAMGNAQVAQAYGGIRGIPTTFLIDKQGRISKVRDGYNPGDEVGLEEDVAKILDVK